MDIEKCVADEMNGDAKKTFSALGGFTEVAAEPRCAARGSFG